jgi:hypothetical protein
MRHHAVRLLFLSQSALPGFFDPAPAMSKLLRIRYVFDDRMHYAELSDDRSVVLPLKGAFSGPRAFESTVDHARITTWTKDHLVDSAR